MTPEKKTAEVITFADARPEALRRVTKRKEIEAGERIKKEEFAKRQKFIAGQYRELDPLTRGYTSVQRASKRDFGEVMAEAVAVGAAKAWAEERACTSESVLRRTKFAQHSPN